MKKEIFKKLKLKNPYILAPMCQYKSINGKPTAWHYQHLGRAIISGFSMIMLESTSVSKEGKITHSDLSLYSKTCMRDYKKLINF